MRAIVLLLFFVGMFIVIHSVYEEKLKRVQENVRVEYKFIPRTLYEEQLAQSNVLSNFKGMFTRDSPWYNSPNTYDFRPLKERTDDSENDKEKEAE